MIQNNTTPYTLTKKSFDRSAITLIISLSTSEHRENNFCKHKKKWKKLISSSNSGDGTITRCKWRKKIVNEADQWKQRAWVCKNESSRGFHRNFDLGYKNGWHNWSQSLEHFAILYAACVACLLMVQARWLVDMRLSAIQCRVDVLSPKDTMNCSRWHQKA